MNPSEYIKDFPILSREISGNKLVYLDNAATTQKPKAVVDVIEEYYFNHNSNVHRGIHTLSEEATEMYERARKTVADFIGGRYEEVAFTGGTTDSINMLASGWATANLKAGDEVVLTDAEHHSNLIPWQVATKRTGAVLKFLQTDTKGMLDTSEAERIIGSKTKLVAMSHASNTLGTIFPVKEITAIAKKYGALVSVDGAQAVPHMKVNVNSLGCDFYSFSGHKMLAPTGIGVLWVKSSVGKNAEPGKYGGGMMESVSYESANWAEIPLRFEAGTPNIGGAIGLMAAINYISRIGIENIREHEVSLSAYALEVLGKIPGLKILGPKNPTQRTGLLSFVLEGIHAHDLAAVLNSTGVAVRAGHHCTMPLHQKLGIEASTRASWYLYNTGEDIDKLVAGIDKAKKIL